MSLLAKLVRATTPLALVGLVLTALPGSASTVGIGAATTYGLDNNFSLVGHTDLSQRGMNSPIAVAGNCAYVGDRDYADPGKFRPNAGIAVVDVSDPTNPHQVNTIPPVALSTQREMRADAGLGILVVLNYTPYIDAALDSGEPNVALNNLQVYDIRDCQHPTLLSTYDFVNRAPHEFFLWKDPNHPGRVLAYVTFTIYSPELMVIDLTKPASPQLVATYDGVVGHAYQAQDFVNESGSGYLHSLSVSDDGRTAYLASWDWGFYELDTSELADPPPAGFGVLHLNSLGRIDYGHNVHSAVKVPGRDIAVFTQEDYANAGHGCPFGYMRLANIADANNPYLLGSFMLPENDPSTCGSKNGTFSSHNPTLFPDVALVTWYSGGLRAVDLTDPLHPAEDGAFVPNPDFVPKLRDERLFFPTGQSATALPTDTVKPTVAPGTPKWTGAMWSYPVVQNGLIYVVDIDLGLYILRYTGPHHEEVDNAAFVEGNSAPSRYSTTTPAIVRPAAQWTAINVAERLHPTVVRSPFADAPKVKSRYGFICL